MSTPTVARPATAATAELLLDAVSFGYAASLVVREVTLGLAAGEMVALIGPNGGGKSTLLRLAAGVLRPRAGGVWLGGHAVARLRRGEIARRIAVVPQDFSVQFAYTVREVVALGRMPHRSRLGLAHTGDRAAVERSLALTGMEALGERVFNELSGGERQRALLALAVAQDAGLVLLDEPTAHLDIKHQIEVLELLRRLNRERGLTVLAVLHDLNLAARYFPRLVLFNQRVIADGPPARVLDASLLERVYEIPVQVGILRGEEHLSVLPPGTAPTAIAVSGGTELAPKMAHVLAGGGSGELLMRALADAGIPFSAGPLNVGDSDYVLARRLAVICYAEPPFAPVSPQGLAAARDRMAEARSVVVCPAPLGPGNVELLDAALHALRAGTDVILLEPGEPARDASPLDIETIRERDFSGRGVAVYGELVAGGARRASSPLEVVRLLLDAPAPPANTTVADAS